ncbi:MAG: hypothetical protein Q8L10_03070, partial [Candidatus Moranbacteria bacterium]|nr:hypothetical protein [Candidatus Moranbacteria bacterium]
IILKLEKIRTLAQCVSKFQRGSVKKFLRLYGRIKNFSDQTRNLDSTSRCRRFLFATFFAAKENGEPYVFL